MTLKTENGIVVPINSDAFRPAAQLKDMADTANVTIPVANQEAREALTKKKSRRVSREDRPGIPTQIWDGTAWVLPGEVPLVVPSPNQYVGSAANLPAEMAAGTIRPIIQAGTNVLPTDLSGYIAFDYPTPFPNGVITLIVTNGDSAQGRAMVFAAAGSPFNQTRQTAFISVVDGNGTPKNKVNVRFNYIAIGW